MFEDFQFSAKDFEKEVNTADLEAKVLQIITDVVKERFYGNSVKSRVRSRGSRINFCCPYCGDSASDNWKMRCNYYPNGAAIHCYNCGKHVSFERFCKDFGKELSGNELVFVRKAYEQTAQDNQKAYIDNSYFYQDDTLDKYAFEKSVIFAKYELVDPNSSSGNWCRKYLLGRCQYNMNLFGWDTNKFRLFIFNLTKTGKILGFQVRNFKTEPKYVTHSNEMIRKHLGLEIEQTTEFEEVNRLSYLFGISTTDFTRSILVTEGPLDSFLLPNCVSTCGTNNDVPFDLANLYYIYDKDKPGMEKAIEKLKSGQNVLLWGKFLKACGIEATDRKLDMTDVFKWCRDNELKVPNLFQFMGNSNYDIYDL